MKKFMSKKFLLTNETAVILFEKFAKDLPIFDYHCHLNPQQIWENKKYDNLTQVWLGGDHYKWRAIRSMGFNEDSITGTVTSDYDKFLCWAKTVPHLIGNPLYHWTHLELQRFFGINEILNEQSAPMIWKEANARLQEDGFTPRALIENSNVYAVCTTDDPADSLEYHLKIQQEGKMKTKVLPAMRPDKALQPETAGFGTYVEALAAAAGMKINSFSSFKEALGKRIEFFHSVGCRACDHAFNYIPFADFTDSEVNAIFKKGLVGAELSAIEQNKYKTALMLYLSEQYAKNDWVMEIHIGALRNNNSRMLEKLGPDTGFDSVNDYNYAPALAKLLSAMDKNNQLPKTILFTLNPKDNYMLSTMLGCFQSDSVASKIQFGSAWWFQDHKYGMEEHLKTLASTGVLSKFIGMVTDSRSFLSYPRHEYFRRIVCNYIGTLVEDGEYPYDEAILKEIIEGISFNNAKNYFNI